MVDMAVPALRRQRAPRGSGERLRNEILDAATELLLETGRARAVSIRSVAERVGITSPSIYLHFKDKDALLDAVCVRHLDQLDEEMVRAADGQPDSMAALRAQGLAYVRYALQAPELYRLATVSAERTGGVVADAMQRAVFRHVRATVQKLIDEGVFRADSPGAVALALMTAAHGVATVLIAKPQLPFGEIDAFTDRMFGAVLCGHLVAGMVGPEATSQQMLEWVRQHRGSAEA
ncbi:TetR family transcriptional regulator [Mycobacterium kiyosense]|uniref:TetR family transcriptional regulator n=2 Tax=Mycobacteriaceae TaxID=1762 RepID=A0A9P3Q539_9MYCO|nr:TetR family transcriptional regulator [Mycobacterium sp. 20KCMC460]GLB81823.1 TetR family transcriptional regulator [Mycobacterium kiyosense]GLB91329.1 TetR family transcriptional regulator [Mycobacterium kiyosense]GLB97346.1 TetR family transcriptional regulator [Mycobacterium kiyosense]GLC02079.1 TetR family transcriptional regulator [Mycobacterium kiyosense]